MVARARKHNESFKKYRINLKKEAAAEKARTRAPGFISIEFFADKVKGMMKRTKTHSDNMRQFKQSRQQARNARRIEMKAARARG